MTLAWQPTAAVADACLRVGAPLRVAPAGLRPVKPGWTLAGPARPARHAGSVDAFLEAIDAAAPGDVLVVDDGGREDEACVGDLVALEARAAGLAGILVWGRHRDSAEVRRVGLPLFSYGAAPNGPASARGPRAGPALFGGVEVAPGDVAFADDDGAVFVAKERVREVVEAAAAIRAQEAAQADAVRAGTTLREQLEFKRYLAARAQDATLTFREHLRRIGGAMEE